MKSIKIGSSAKKFVHSLLLALALVIHAACAPIVPLPTIATPTPAPTMDTTSGRPSLTPSPTSTPMVQPSSTASPSPTPRPCELAARAPLTLIDDDVYFSFGPTSNEIDEALASAYPQWLGFRQTVMERPLTAGDVFKQASFGGSEYGVNPAVLLVVVGMDLNWEPPADGDLFGRAVQAGKTLRPFYVDYYTEEQVRAAYAHIGNASTYALY